MGPQEIYDRCMQGSLRKLVKGGLVYQYAINPYFVWCEANAPRSEKDPESPYMTLIFENGRVHEQEVCDLQFPGGVALDPTLYEQAFRQTLEALFQGEKYIKNGIVYFLPEGYVAVPDILEKKQGPSLLGDFHYEVIEVKSSRQIRTEHILQGAYYTFIMGIIQGVTPEAFSLVDGKKNREYFSYKEYEPLLQETIRSIKDIYQGKEVPPSKLNWPWSSYSLKKLLEQQHISLIPNLYQSHRQLLEQAGVNSLQDFFSLHALGVTGIHPQAMERYKRTAKAFLQHRHAFLEKPFLPEKPVEIFLDFEGVEELRLNGHKVSCDYLIGVLLREDGRERYIPFISPTPEKEHEMVLAFLRFLQGVGSAERAQPDDPAQDGGHADRAAPLRGNGAEKAATPYVIYHFGPYEKSHLAALFRALGADEALGERILGSMVDILPLLRKSVVFPTTSYSLKDIGKYLGFRWRDVGSAKDSIVLYLDYLKGNPQSLEKIIQYNEDDCLALKRVKDFLVWGT